MRSFFLSVAAGLVVAASAAAQAAPPAAAPLPPPTPVMLGGTVVSGPVVCSTPSLGICLPGKCAGPACMPEVKPAKKTVYSTITREHCVPTRSCWDMLMSCCGLGSDCNGPTGETHTKTLLVKKQVPKCEEACATCVAAPAATVVLPPPATPVKK